MKRQNNQTKRYAIYARCSSDDQAHRDFSTVDVQLDLNRQYVQEQGGILAGVYNDDGITGTHVRRKDFLRMVSDAGEGLFDVVVCTYVSRLGRDKIFDVAEYLLNENDATVEMVKEKFSDDMPGFIQKRMTQFGDGMYVQQVRQWTKTKMKAMVRAGYVCGGTVPLA